MFSTNLLHTFWLHIVYDGGQAWNINNKNKNKIYVY